MEIAANLSDLNTTTTTVSLLSTGIGFLCVILGAVCLGSWLIPLKIMTARTDWKWYHAWVFYSPVAFIIYPSIVTLSIVPDVGLLLSMVDLNSVMAIFWLGFVWGVGNSLMGLVSPKIGVSLTGTLNPAMVLLSGTILPASIFNLSALTTLNSAPLIYSGLLMSIIAILCSFMASNHREKFLAEKSIADNADETGPLLTVKSDVKPRNPRTIVLYSILAVLSGFFASLLNLSFSFGRGPISKQAIALGSFPYLTANFTWSITLLGAFIPSYSIAFYQICKKRAWGPFKQIHVVADGVTTDQVFPLWKAFLYACMQATLQFVGFTLYALGAYFLGPLGPSAGWASFEAISILTTNLYGLFYFKEWKTAGPIAMRYFYTALFLLIVAIGFLIASTLA